jgi:DNA helicase-2/ATP-dependent DNA helicase PcrA
LFILIASTTDRSPHIAFDFRGRVVVCRLLAEAAAARQSAARAADWVVDATERFARVLTDADFLPIEAATILRESAAQMRADILTREGGEHLTVEDLGIFARPKECIHLLTVHKAKGREFDAVAVIQAHDGTFPHFSIRQVEDPILYKERFDESRRVFYVATTRAKQVLMFFSDKAHVKNRPTPFLAEMDL